MTNFSVEVLPNSIICFTIPNFTRQVVDEWKAYVLKHDGEMKAPLRVIYDFRDSGYPSTYVLEEAGGLMNELQIPDDTRTAYLVHSRYHVAFGEILAHTMPERAGQVRVFSKEDEAVRWLLDS